MIRGKACIVFYAVFISLCTACASKIFTQRGVVSDEEICYENVCYTTVNWEDGSSTNVENRFLPDKYIVYRHCYINEEGDTECQSKVYEQPIAIFNRDEKKKFYH